MPIRLKQLRESKDLSLREFAQQIGLTFTALHKIETGVNDPKWKTIASLADYFHVSADYLMGRSDDPKFNTSSEYTPEEIELACSFIRKVRELDRSILETSQDR